MSSSTFRTSCSALVAAAAFALSGAASASFYDSSFDPPFFNGTAVFEIADGCLATNGENAANSGSCSPVSMQAVPSPIVNLDDSSGHTATLNFTGFVDDFDDMDLVAVISGKFAGIRTEAIGGFPAAGPDASFFPGFFFLRFDYIPTFSDGELLSDTLPTLSSDGGELVSVKNFVQIINCRENNPSAEDCVIKDTSRNVTFTLIPEPGSLALILGGLGAGWWTRRRKTHA